MTEPTYHCTSCGGEDTVQYVDGNRTTVHYMCVVCWESWVWNAKETT